MAHPDAERLPVLPTRAVASEVAWNQTISKSRGIYGFDSMDPRSRSFNLIRARILELRRERNWRMFGVVSATPNVGKSFIAANVAAAVSRDPRHCTYLLDFDLRRGSLSSVFGVRSGSDLRKYLERAPGVDAPAAFTFQGEELILLPTAPGHIHSAELLASERAQSLLKAMRLSDDANLFIVDLPPVFANDDASTTMEMLDSYILVAEEGKSTQREIEDAVAMLGEERLAGVILNKYRGGVVSEGYGVEEHYASGYGKPVA